MSRIERLRDRAQSFLATSQATSDGPGLYGTYVGDDRVVIKLPWGRHLRAVASDLSLTPELLTRGMYDRPFWHFVNRTLRPGDHAVDVGANIGLFTVAMSFSVGREGRVTAYEPDATMAQLVRENLLSNWVAEQATVVQSAAGSAEGTTTFAWHPSFLGSSSAGAADLSAHAVVEGYETRTVAVERVDQRVRGSVKLAKVDVEGGEADALAGMSGLEPEFLDVEVLRSNAHNWDALVEELRRLQGRPHTINDDGTLSSLPLGKVIDVGDWPHIVFA